MSKGGFVANIGILVSFRDNLRKADPLPETDVVSFHQILDDLSNSSGGKDFSRFRISDDMRRKKPASIDFRTREKGFAHQSFYDRTSVVEQINAAIIYAQEVKNCI